MSPEVHEALFFWTVPGILTALISGIGLGAVIAAVRPTVTAPVVVWSGTAIAALWYLPLAAQRLLDPALHANGLRTMGNGLLFEAFMLVAAVTVALIGRRGP